MLFLLNDVVYRMDPANLALSKAHRSEAAKPLRDVEHKIRKLYATDPRLHRTSPERAALIIKLIIAKLPDVNAAWFGAPQRSAIQSGYGSVMRVSISRLSPTFMAGNCVAPQVPP